MSRFPESPSIPKFSCVDGEELNTETAYRLLVGCVVPRPIAWVTTMDAQGRVNAAPFSSYNYVATSPPMLAINIAKRPGSGATKDTAHNISTLREFVVNVATLDNMDLMHQSAQEFPPEVSEVEVLGIPLLASTVKLMRRPAEKAGYGQTQRFLQDGFDAFRHMGGAEPFLATKHVRVPRIACSPVQMECRLDQVVQLGRGINTLYIGEVVAFHLSDAVYDGQRIDSAAMRPIARLGGPYYGALGDIIHRPMLQKPPGGEGWAPVHSTKKRDGDLS